MNSVGGPVGLKTTYSSGSNEQFVWAAVMAKLLGK